MTFKPNGCGAKGGWFRPPQWHSYETCCLHDIAYHIGGTEADRRLADRDLLNGMIRDAADRPWQQQPWYRLQAWIYYRAVRWSGRAHFHYHDDGPPSFAPVLFGSTNPVIIGSVEVNTGDGYRIVGPVTILRREVDQQ